MENSFADGIDVSKWQRNMKWSCVKPSGYVFSMIRLGISNTQNVAVLDECFVSHVNEALKNGVMIGAYFYSKATKTETAKKEADFVISQLKNYRGKFTYPIVLDYEDEVISNDVKLNTEIVKTFCKALEDAKFYPMIYSSKSILENKLNMPELSQFDTWVAHYTPKTTYRYPYSMWQYSNVGKLSGYSGDVDLNHVYKDFPAIIKGRGFN